MKNISISKDEQGIVLATIDMPDRPFNVFSEDMMADLSSLIESIRSELSSSMPPRGLVITSGKSSFVAGADLAMIQDFGAMRFRASREEMRERYSYLGRLFRQLELLPVPVVAAVNGLALGGGLELAMACHRRVCADAPHVQLGLPEVRLGLLPGAGGTQRLPRYVGLALGTRMLLDGRPLNPQQALNCGLVDLVVAPEVLLETAKAMVLDTEAGAPWDKAGYESGAEELSSIDSDFDSWSRSLAGISEPAELYPAISAIQKCVHDGYGKPIDEACNIEWDIFVDLMSNPVSSNMVTTGFLSKTAATKLSQYQLPRADHPEAYSLARDLNLGTLPFRTVNELAWGEGGYEIVPVAMASERGDLAVVDLVTDDSDNCSDKPCLRIVGDFSSAEAVELVKGKDSEATAKALALLSTSGKAVVLTDTETSVNSVLLSGIRKAWSASDMSTSRFMSLGAAVGLDKMMRHVLPCAAQLAVAESDRAAGNMLLLLLCERVYHWIEPRLTGKGDKDMLAGVDLLAVYGAGFPKWTGGPLSCLGMFQRGEIDCPVASDLAASLEWTFKDELGYCAALKSQSEKCLTIYGQ